MIRTYAVPCASPAWVCILLQLFTPADALSTPMDMFVAEQRLVFRHARDICSFIAAHIVFIQLEGVCVWVLTFVGGVSDVALNLAALPRHSRPSVWQRVVASVLVSHHHTQAHAHTFFIPWSRYHSEPAVFSISG